MKNKLQIIWMLVALFYVGNAAADPGKESINSNLNNLNQQINSLNQDLNSKQQKKKALDSALKNSQNAINSAELLLQKLRLQRDADVRQLKQLQVSIPLAESATVKAQDNVEYSIARLYRQIRQLELEESSILNGNTGLDSERKKVYLISILKSEQAYYTELSAKLLKLQEVNRKLQSEVERLDDQLGDAKDKHKQLLTAKTATLRQASSVAKQIEQEKAQLSHLKQRQAQLNRLLRQLAEAERRQKQQALAAKKAADLAAKNNKTMPASTLKQSAPDNSVEDNSPFLQRKLVKPVDGKILVGFGQRRDTVKNTGVLLATKDNVPVYSISGGSVLFSGELPGFGQIIVIDNGDNYTSVYSGVLAKIAKGSHVTSGQVIANSGVRANQPMGGVYFELRHLGTPVNPSKIFD